MKKEVPLLFSVDLLKVPLPLVNSPALNCGSVVALNLCQHTLSAVLDNTFLRGLWDTKSLTAAAPAVLGFILDI